MREVVIVPTYKRDELLYCCLRRLRGQDCDVPIFVFSDRGERSANLEYTCDLFNAQLVMQPRHSYHGNSFSAGEALRFAYNSGYDLIHYVEDDAFAKPDFFKWTREMHQEWEDIFCSCGWVFNLFMPIVDETYFAPWIYIPQFSIKSDKLALVMEHLNPLYFADMWGYVAKNFPDNPINAQYPNVVHYEIDGLLQRVLMQHGLQVAWNGIAKVEHCGAHGYNRGGYNQYEDFFDATASAGDVEKTIR